MTELKIGSFVVKFPYEPYQAQTSYMEKVIECLQEKKFGLLESPTGTGKTIALLCSSIAWLEQSKSTLNVQSMQGDPNADIKALLNGDYVPPG